MPAELGVIGLPSGDTRASIDCDDLPGDVSRSVGGEQCHDPLEVVPVAEPVQGRVSDDLLAELLQRSPAHLRGEKSRRDGVHRDAVLAPFRGKRARKIDNAPFGRVVAERLQHAYGVAAQPRDRRDVDDSAIAVRDHRALSRRLGHEEGAGQVQVHELLPRLQGVILGRRAPGGARVVDEDIQPPVALEESRHHRLDRFGLRQIADERQRLDVLPSEMRSRLFQLLGFPRGDRELRAHLAERLGDLQPEAARAAGDQRDLSGEIEEFSYAHEADCRLTRIFAQSNLRRPGRENAPGGGERMLRGLIMDMPLLVSSLIEHADRSHGDTEIVSRTVEGPGKDGAGAMHRYTYSQAHRRSKRLAQALARLGAKEGERAGTLAWNGYRHLELYYGASRARTETTRGRAWTSGPRRGCATARAPPATPRACSTPTGPPSCTPTPLRCPTCSAARRNRYSSPWCRCSTSTPGAFPISRRSTARSSCCPGRDWTAGAFTSCSSPRK